MQPDQHHNAKRPHQHRIRGVQSVLQPDQRYDPQQRQRHRLVGVLPLPQPDVDRGNIPQNPFYTSANGVLFDKSQTTLLGYPGGLSGSYIIPSRVNSIGYGAFSGCTSLINVTNPPSVSSIGDNAFYYCTSLASVYFDGNAPTAGSSVFGSDTKATAYYLPGTSGWSLRLAVFRPVMLNPPIPAGSLLVSIARGAITAGAQWQVDGGIPQRRGAAVLGLSVRESYGQL